MENFFRSDWMPHGHCFLWDPAILWPTVIADIAIAIAYFSIPLGIVAIIQKRSDVKFRGVIWLFAAFILLCGLTHVVSVVNLWNGYYGLHAIVKVLTAVVSVFTAIALYKHLNYFVTLPTQQKILEIEQRNTENIRTQLHLEARENAQKLLKQVSLNLPLGMIIIDSDSTIIFSNSRAGVIFGLSVNELDKRNLREFINPEALNVPQSLGHRLEPEVETNTSTYVLGRAHNGKEVELKIKESQFDIDGQPHTLVMIEHARPLIPKYEQTNDEFKRIVNATALSDVGVWEINLSTDEFWCSEKFCDLSFLDASISNTLDDFRHNIFSEDLDDFDQALSNHRDHGASLDVCVRVVNDKADTSWVRISGESTPNEEGETGYLSGTISNIQPLRELEAHVNQQNAFLEQLYARSISGYYILDLRTQRNTFINAEFTRITGLTLEEVNKAQADNTFGLFHPDDRARVKQHLARMIDSKNDEPEEIECRILNKAKGWVWCFSRDAVFKRDINGAPIEILGSFVDVTDLKAQQEETAQLSKRYTEIFEQAAVGIARIGPTGRVLQANKTLSLISGYDPEKLVTLTVDDLSFPDDRELGRSERARIANGTLAHYQLDKRMLRANKDVIWVKLTVTGVLKNGVLEYLIAVVEDITEQKLTEFSLTQSNQALERFAFAASHDLKEPARKVATFTSALIQRFGETDVDEQTQYELSRLNQASKRMNTLVDSLLSLARTNNEALVKKPTQINAMIDDIRQNMSDRFPAVHFNITTQGLIALSIDPVAFQQVLTNLITNAINYRSPERATHIEITLEKRERDQIDLLRVTDNGVGISERYFQTIFEPFKRLADKRIEGSGMGLSICKQIVEGHNGKIYIESSSEQGTTFAIELPSIDGLCTD